ncbi:MAG: hypothetical protein JWM27_342 [Gemmatimonadetes bacterium]|nr:hypothetical protein [Gemmatimonadota bacterium]
MTPPPGPRFRRAGGEGRLGRFWRRQFDSSPTGWQTAFDAAFGIVLPLACLALDPAVFVTHEGQPGMMGYLRPFAYTMIALQTAALAARMPRRPGSSALDGFLLAGALFAGLLGIVLAPLCTIGILAGEGICALGFTPLGTAFVFARAAVRARRAAGRERPAGSRTRMVAGLLLGLGIPLAAQVGIDRTMDASVRTIPSADAAAAASAVRRVAVLRRITDDSPLILAWRAEHDVTRRAAYARAFRQLAGHPIEDSVVAD